MQPLFLSSQRLISAHWPAVERLLAPVLDAARGEFTLDDLRELCREGRALSGLAFKDGEPVMAFVLEFVHYPRAMHLRVIALGGSDVRGAARTFWPSFVEWAAECGVSHIEAYCAPAMTRLLRPLGFQHTYDTVRLSCH